MIKIITGIPVFFLLPGIPVHQNDARGCWLEQDQFMIRESQANSMPFKYLCP